jgi:hypothetical protein
MSAPPIEIPTPAGVQANNGIDLASDLSPTSPVDRKKIEDLIGKRSTPAELKGKGILKGE